MTAVPPERAPQLDLGFVRRGARTVLDRRVFRWPFVLTRTFALDRSPAHLVTAILQTSSGAVHRGDGLRQRIRVGPGAAVHCTTPGATPIHGGSGACPASDAVEIAVEPDGYLEYLPEARILFPGAALDQSLEVDCALGATAVVADAFTVHDPDNRGEFFDRLRATLTVRRAGTLLAIDRAVVEGADVADAAPFRAFGTVLLLQPGMPERESRLIEAVRVVSAGVEGLYAAAMVLPSDAGVAVRLAGHDLQRVRYAVARIWQHVRRDLFGGAPSDRHLAAAASPFAPGASLAKGPPPGSSRTP